MSITSQEKILIPLRELYRRDKLNRKLIAEYANNFKKCDVFLYKEAKFLSERLSANQIDFDRALLPVKLLTVELVPQSCWFSNVRDHVPKPTWDKLRKTTYQQAHYQCEVCGGRGKRHPVECHEIWDYDDLNYVQTLEGLTALCPDCHQVKHIGLAGLRGYGEQAEAHLAKINGWSKDERNAYLETVWETWHQRSSHEWTLDLSWLEGNYGLKINPKR
ncbi:MAG: HNH endonuclease signature motif containing protein [Xenococcaceae cyanobacterium MO_167.B52]|nr:HNH endonuclease signature motif containing protein [Xenococcaceae cyanobacterium MO_167.B52]